MSLSNTGPPPPEDPYWDHQGHTAGDCVAAELDMFGEAKAISATEGRGTTFSLNLNSLYIVLQNLNDQDPQTQSNLQVGLRDGRGPRASCVSKTGLAMLATSILSACRSLRTVSWMKQDGLIFIHLHQRFYLCLRCAAYLQTFPPPKS